MKRAFGLVTAIMIILFIGSVVLIGMKYARVGVKHYADTYLKEQAKLYIQSVKERVIYDIGLNKCKTNFEYETTIGKEKFTAEAEVKYFYYNKTNELKCNKGKNVPIKSPQSNGMIALKIQVYNGSKSVYMIDRSVQRP